MSIIRNKRTSNFTTIPNSLINDHCLRWNDLGLLVYLLSKPETWTVRVDVLVKERGIGKDAVYEILKRLREAGYARLIRFSDGSTEWTIYDNPNQENPDKAKPNPENPDLEKPDPENPDLDNPDVYKRKSISKERVLVNTEKESKEKINKKEKIDPIREELNEVTDQTFSDFIELRKAKKAPLTIRAIESIRKEAEKAGISLENALIECCARGWVGFKAEWYMKTQIQNARASPSDRDEFNKRQTEIAKQKLFGISSKNEKDITHEARAL